MAREISRREFLKAAGVAATTLALNPYVKAAPSPALVKISGEGVARDLAGALKKLLEPLGGMAAFVKKGQSVLIKPNLGFPTPPAQRATTDPRLVRAVVDEVLACSPSRVLVADNPVRRPEACLRENGVQEALKGLDVRLLHPTSEKFYREVELPRARVLKKTAVFKEALSVDVHIALPVAKSHNAAGFSGALKGMMGLVLDRESFHSRYDLNQAIADLCTLLRPALTIMDGLSVMSTDGPAGPGKIITCNALIAGTDALAVDALGVQLAPLYGRKLKPSQIKHLKLAAEMGLGTLEPAGAGLTELSF